MKLVINSLIYLSILRLIYFPFFGRASTYATAIASILLAAILVAYFKIDKSKLIIVFYSLLLLILNLFAPETSFNFKIISYFETITPFLLLGSISSSGFSKYVRKNIKFFKNGIILLLLILLIGHLIEFLGYPLPKVNEAYLTRELVQQFSIRFRIGSFVGVAGPYALSLTYLLISLQIFKPKISFPIFIFGFITLLYSFSRLGLTIFLIFNVTVFLLELLKVLNFKNGLIKKRALFISLTLASLIFLGINFEFGDKLNIVFNRFLDGFDFTQDAGNVERLERFQALVIDFKQDNIMNILIGDGTGITARAVGAPQGESQIAKIYIEWGLIGISLILVWLLEIVGILKLRIDQVLIKINSFKLALFITIFVNLFFIQAFTSSPIFVSMVFPLIAIHYREFIKDDIKIN